MKCPPKNKNKVPFPFIPKLLRIPFSSLDPRARIIASGNVVETLKLRMLLLSRIHKNHQTDGSTNKKTR